MAHARTRIEFAPHVTVLTGPNNSGKSAVVEGLRALATSPAAGNLIRHGAKQARITLELADGTRVRWERKKASAVYRILPPGWGEERDGTPDPYAKYGQSVPEDVRDALRLDPVVLENRNESVDVHFGNQRSPVFLVDDTSGGRVAAFFASSSESAHLLAMQKALKLRVRDTKSRADLHRGRMDGLATELDALAGLPVIGCTMEHVRLLDARIGLHERDIPALESLLTRRKRVQARLQQERAKAGALAPLHGPSALSPTQELAAHLQRYGRLQTERTHAHARRERLARATPPPPVADTAGLAAHLRDMAAVRTRLLEAMAREGALKGLAKPPQATDTIALVQTIARLRTLRRRKERAERTGAALAGVAPPPQADAGTDALAATIARLRETARRREALQAERDALAVQLAEARASIEATLAEAGACPLCGSAMRAEDFTGEGDGPNV